MALTINQAVMSEVQTILLDPTGVYWTPTYLLAAYNIVITAIIRDNPNALTQINSSFALAAGVDQSIPLANGVQYIRMPANTVSGRGIRPVSADDMMNSDINWYAGPQTTDVRHVIIDPLDPLKFRVWPPNNGQGQVNLQYAYAPPDATATNFSDPFGLTEAYRIDVRNGILGMAYALNTDRQDLQKAEAYLNRLSGGVQSAIKAQYDLTQKTAVQQESPQ